MFAFCVLALLVGIAFRRLAAYARQGPEQAAHVAAVVRGLLGR